MVIIQMLRLVHIQQLYNFDIELNYIPYRLRFRYCHQKKKMVPVLSPLEQLTKNKSKIHGGAYQRGYVGSIGPKDVQIQPETLEQWVVDMKQDPLDQQLDMDREHSDKQITSHQELPSFAPVTKKGQPPISTDQDTPYFNELPLPQSLKDRQDFYMAGNKNKYCTEQINEQFGDDQFVQFQLESEQEYEQQMKQVLSQNRQKEQAHKTSHQERYENKLEDTTKSNLKSQRSNESKIEKELSNLISGQQKQELQQIHQNSLQVQASRQEKTYQNPNQQLQYSNRVKTQKNRNSKKHLQKKTVYTKLNDYLRQVGAFRNKTEASRSNESSEQHRSLNEEWSKRQQTSKQYEQDNQEQFIRQSEPSEKESHSSSEQHYQEAMEHSQCKNSYMKKHTITKQLQKQFNRLQSNKQQQQKQSFQRNSKHPSIFLKNQKIHESEPTCSYRIAKIHQLANLVPQHPSEFQQHYESLQQDVKKSAKQKYSSGYLPQLFASHLKSEKQELESYESQYQSSHRKIYNTENKNRSSVYGRQYLNKKQYETAKKAPPRKAPKKKVKQNHFNSQIVESMPNDFDSKREDSGTEHNTPQTQRNMSKDIHIWSFSDLLSEQDIKGLRSRQEESDVLGHKASPYDISSVEYSEEYQTHHVFRKDKKVESFPNYKEFSQDHEINKAQLNYASEENHAKQQNVHLRNPNNSLEEENLINLIGGSDKMKELSSMALQSREQADWNQHNLKQQLSHFLKANKIPFDTPSYQNEVESASLFSSFHLDSQNATTFNLEQVLREDSKRTSCKEDCLNSHSCHQVEQDIISEGNFKQQKRLESPRKQGNSWLEEVDMEIIQELDSNNMPSSKASQFQFFTNDPRQFRSHFHPRRQAIQRFIHSNTGSIEQRRKAVQSRQKGYDSLSPCKQFTGELGFLKRKKQRLDKNLTRFNTRLHKY